MKKRSEQEGVGSNIPNYFHDFLNFSIIANLPNLLSIIRLLSSPLVFYFLTKKAFGACFILLFIISITDFLDGYFARKLNACSMFGAAIDPLADKALIFFFYYGAYVLKAVPFWLFFLITLRDVLIIIVALNLIFAKPRTESGHLATNIDSFSPLFISKLNTCLQLVLALVILVNLSVKGDLINLMSEILVWTVGITTILSGILYLVSYLTPSNMVIKCTVKK